MNPPKLHLYYDAESDYLEIRFGEPTESYYEKIGPDTFVRKDEKTNEVKGYAIFNVQKSKDSLKSIDFDIPLNILKELKTEATS
jgi:hypothetical protein